MKDFQDLKCPTCDNVVVALVGVGGDLANPGTNCQNCGAIVVEAKISPFIEESLDG